MLCSCWQGRFLLVFNFGISDPRGRVLFHGHAASTASAGAPPGSLAVLFLLLSIRGYDKYSWEGKCINTLPGCLRAWRIHRSQRGHAGGQHGCTIRKYKMFAKPERCTSCRGSAERSVVNIANIASCTQGKLSPLPVLQGFGAGPPRRSVSPGKAAFACRFGVFPSAGQRWSRAAVPRAGPAAGQFSGAR